MEYLDKVVLGKADFLKILRKQGIHWEYRDVTGIPVNTSHKFADKT
jgi:hypothetical protein